MPSIRPLPIPNFELTPGTASLPIPYLVQGTTDEGEVHELVVATIPASYRGLVPTNLRSDNVGGGVWICTVDFTPLDRQQSLKDSGGTSAGSGAAENPTAPGSSEPLTALNGGASLSFDTTGQTTHVTQSRETRWMAAPGDVHGVGMQVDAVNNLKVDPDGYVPNDDDVGKIVQITQSEEWTGGIYTITAHDGTYWTLNSSPAATGTTGGLWTLTAAQNFKQAIGVTRDRIEGCDIFAPKLEFQIDVQRSNVTLDYLLTLFAQTGKVNYAAPFWNFPVGTVLYLGASGKFSFGDRWNLSHKFAYSPNETDFYVSFPDILIPEKKGWDHLWVRYADSDLADGVLPLPSAAYVEVVYETGDFDALEIG